MSADPLAPYRDLRAGPGRSERFIVEGVLAVERLLQSELEPESILCTPSARARLEVPEGVPVFERSKAEIAALAGFEFHRGVLASARRPPLRRTLSAPELERLRERERVTVVVAEALADPRNLGALIRNAAAFAADLVIADAAGADPFSRLTIRASVGNVFRARLLVSDELRATVDALARELSAELIAATPEPGAVSLRDLRPPPRRIVLVGNEGAGLSSSLLAMAGLRVRIPVAPESDSINVAAATAVLLYALS